jgi:adenosylmethionine-8-amino-7-oxononanoate aminotransferase
VNLAGSARPSRASRHARSCGDASSTPSTSRTAPANLDIIAKEKLVERTKEKTGPYFQKKLQEFVGHPAVGEVRGLGLIGAMELVPKGGRKDLKPGMNLGILGAAKVRKEGTIVRGIREEGGLFTMQDLANWRVRIEEPYSTTYRGVQVFKLPI